MELKELVSEDEIFSRCGPTDLKKIDWNNSYHRTAVVASLVKGVYTLERDRQKKRFKTPESQAQVWWEHFHFSLHKTLSVDSDGVINGAIFEYKDKDTNPSGMHPHYVVAFRGSMKKRVTWLRDVLLDIRGFNNLLYGNKMCEIIGEIKSMVCNYGYRAIWLAGHSLGASMALYAGKTMASSGYPMEAYIFNPITALTSLKVLNPLKFVVRVAGNIIRTTIVKATSHDKVEEAESFMDLAGWIPYLYVNPMDPICSKYIDYFKERKRMSDLGLSVNLGTRYTKTYLFSTGGGERGERDVLPRSLHILPSTYLMINTTISPKHPRAHGIVKDSSERKRLEKSFKAHQICQWWDPHSTVKCELFDLKDDQLRHQNNFSP